MKKDILLKYLFSGQFGLEQECLRIDDNGDLSQNSHPFNDKHIDRDFCESQIEMITDVYSSIDELYDQLLKLRKHVSLTLKDNNEHIWPFSTPMNVDENKIPLAHFDDVSKNKYREYLSSKYGQMKMLYSGIHYNFSFPNHIIYELFEDSHYTVFKEFKNNLYMSLGKKVIDHSWLIVYLTAASPTLNNEKKYASPRCSKIGYWNKFLPILNFDSLNKYIKSVQYYIDNKMLIAPSELYYPVRFKTTGTNSLIDLKTKGINHIELRMLDLNPLDICGININDLKFIYLLLIYLVCLDDYTINIENAIHNMKVSALYNDNLIDIIIDNKKINIKEHARSILNKMILFFNDNNEAKTIIDYQINKINTKRYCEIINDNYSFKGLNRAKELSDKLRGENHV